ncbi:MAG: YqgE/AlgH family protein [Bacteroidia bacterium]|nr:YqgE/AlgH family protein [Bacteroidia bacterium]
MLFDKIFGNEKPARGMFLVSEPFMMDPNFRRTVVLITEHDEKGTVGFVLNKELEVKPHEAITDFPEFDHPLLLGGPVQKDNLFFIHSLGGRIKGALEITHGLFWGGDYEEVKKLLARGELHAGNVRFFVGYSGWDSGQLDKELEINSWIVARGGPSDLFETPPDDLWKKVLRRMGKDFAVVADLPEDPSLN